MRMIKKVNMKWFIYFFVFFLLLTLGLFYFLENSGARAIQESLVNSSKNQLSYADSIINGVISEASVYGAQYTAENSVRYLQSQKHNLGPYDFQMQKNAISNRLLDPLLSSQAIESIAIYWGPDGDFISTGSLSPTVFESVTQRGWQYVNGSFIYYSVYPYFFQPEDLANIQYVVGVKLKTEYLAALLEKAYNGSNSNAYFLVGNNTLISSKTVNNEIVEKAKKTIKPDSQEIFKFDYKTHDGTYYVLTKYIKPIDTYLVTYTRTNAFMNPLNLNNQVFFLSILVILVIGLIMIFMFYRNFYRNVYLLNKKFYQVEKGDYGTRIIENPDNEFFNLFQSFNHMVAKIQALFASLKIETDLRRNAEIKQLQSQINPHFLYNSLFFIMSLAKTSPEAVMQMSKHLAEYYRYLTKIDSHEITLASEMVLVDHYLSIMSLCKNIKYTINLAPELRDWRMMPLIIQPIVENAIQHGIEERQGAHRVSIDVKAANPGALIVIANDGKGLTPDEIKQLEARVQNDLPPKGTNGIGLWNVNQRLKNIYGESSSLHFFINDWGGLTVTFTIDFFPDEGGHYAVTDRG
jgi:two-component system sensor histidine kinase YesM